MRTNKFELGDEVRCKDVSSGGSSGWTAGKIIKINKFEFRLDEFLYWAKDNMSGIWEKDLEFAKITDWKNELGD